MSKGIGISAGHRSIAFRWPAAWAILALLGSPRLVSAQLVSGRLIDDMTGAPVIEAAVQLLRLDGEVVAATATVMDGTFALQAPEQGQYAIRASHIAYERGVSPPLYLERGVTIEVEFRIAYKVVLLAPLTVVGRRREATARDPRLERRGYYERKASYGKEGNGLGFAYFLEGEDIRPTAFAVSDLLRDLPGIYVHAAGARDVVVTGRNGCRLGYYLDGVAVGTSLDGVVVPSDIVAVEVYTGSVKPLEYGAGRCGAVAVWTGIREHR